MKRLLTICAAAALVLVVSGLAQAAIINVPADYTTIQAAINAAGSGDTILVVAGTYEENITVNKALTIRSTGGAEGTIIDGTSTYIVAILHSDVTFDGFTVTNPDFATSGDVSGILIGGWGIPTPPVNVHVLNNIVKAVRSESGTPSTYGATGINIGTSRNVIVSGNTITDIKNPEEGANDHTCGINVWGDYGTYGLRPSRDIVISNNMISDIKYNGILLEYASNVRIENNAITECDVGVRADPFEGVTVSDVTVKYNSISGNSTYGVYNGAGTLDATKNWWGSPTGPCRQLPNGKWVGKGDKVSSNVDYIPWLPWMP